MLGKNSKYKANGADEKWESSPPYIYLFCYFFCFLVRDFTNNLLMKLFLISDILFNQLLKRSDQKYEKRGWELGKRYGCISIWLIIIAVT